MKTFKISVLVILLSTLSAMCVMAQAGMEDVIYLKNGNIYRGVIIEQVPNVSMKIKTLGGNVFAVNISEVEKITKEDKPAPQMRDDFPYGMHHRFNDSTYSGFKYRKNGKFVQLQVLLDNKQGGVHLVLGYKFNQHAALGLGFGPEYVFSSPFNERINHLPSRALAGMYVPLYLFLTGDMFPKRVTPFYAIEAGYFMAGLQRGRDFHDMSFRSRPDAHGAMGSLGLGVKFYSKGGGLNFNLLFNLNVKNVNYREDVLYYDVFGTPYMVNEHKNATLVFPGIRFGLGFTSSGHHMGRMKKG